MATDIKYYKFFADYIQKHIGIIYQEKDYYRLDARFKSLIEAFSLKDVDELYDLFQKKITEEMHQKLIDISTNNETYFMRDMKPFEALTDEVIPEIWSRGIRNLNLWSCAASTGQEILSILMSISETGNKEWLNSTRIYATDISSRALQKAKEGIYNNLDVQRGLPAPLLVKYFTQTDGDMWKFDPKIQQKVQYEELNLLDGPYQRNFFDIIFCRNVLIYQDHDKKAQILEHLFNALKPGGYFFMGSGESTIGMKTDFKPVKLKNGLIYQRPLN
jgi:chemotaxis protein methyltransferase CheR